MLGSDGCAFLESWGVVQISGNGAFALLQGMITNDMGLITPHQGIYAAILTPQGRFSTEVFITQDPVQKGYRIEIRKNRCEEFLKKLKLYTLNSDVQWKDLSQSYGVWGEWKEVLPPISLEKFPLDSTIYADPRHPAMGRRYLLPQETFPVPDIEKQKAQAIAYDGWRLKHGIPEEPMDLIPGKSIPLECQLDTLHALSWTKGCYLGQELTARTKHRGLIRKALFPVTSRVFPRPPGTLLYHGDQEVGTLTSSQQTFGLALIRLEVLEKTLCLLTQDQQKVFLNVTPKIPSDREPPLIL